MATKQKPGNWGDDLGPPERRSRSLSHKRHTVSNEVYDDESTELQRRFISDSLRHLKLQNQDLRGKVGEIRCTRDPTKLLLLREKFQECNNLASAIRDMITAAGKRQILSRTAQQHLVSDLERLEKEIRDLQSTVSTLPPQSSHSISYKSLPSNSYEDTVEETPENLRIHENFQEFSLHEEELIKEREEDLLQLNADMASLRDTFLDFSELVQEQGQKLDVVEANVESASIKTEQAVKDLAEASRLSAGTWRTKATAGGAFVLGVIGSVGGLPGAAAGVALGGAMGGWVGGKLSQAHRNRVDEQVNATKERRNRASI